MTAIQVPGLLTFTIAIVVFFMGSGLNRLIKPLHRWNIPEAVTGGLLAAIVTLLAYKVLGIEVSFSLDARDLLLLYFFTGIGLNARLDDLASGGRPLLLLLVLTLVYLVIQNLIAAGSVAALGLPKGITAFVGSASLIGGHGTTIAWAPIITERFGLSNALEVGIATATLGLVVASLVGGPIAAFSSPVTVSPDRRRPTLSSACPTPPPRSRSTTSAMTGFCALYWCPMRSFSSATPSTRWLRKPASSCRCSSFACSSASSSPIQFRACFRGSNGRRERERWRWSQICRSMSSWQCR